MFSLVTSLAKRYGQLRRQLFVDDELHGSYAATWLVSREA